MEQVPDPVAPRRRPPVLRALALSILLGACAAVPTPGPASERLFVQVQRIDVSRVPPIIEVDPAEWLTGTEADRAAVEDGVIPLGEQLPNGFYIRDRDHDPRTLVIAPGAPVVLTFWRGNPGQTTVIDIGRWAGFFDPGADAQDAVLRDAPYWLTLVNGLVTEIEQQYVP